MVNKAIRCPAFSCGNISATWPHVFKLSTLGVLRGQHVEILLEPKMGHSNCENVKNMYIAEPDMDWRIFWRKKIVSWPRMIFNPSVTFNPSIFTVVLGTSWHFFTRPRVMTPGTPRGGSTGGNSGARLGTPPPMTMGARAPLSIPFRICYQMSALRAKRAQFLVRILRGNFLKRKNV